MYPDLARSWEISKDGKEYIFCLREQVKFHHGKELDSGDVKYSLDRVMNHGDPKPGRCCRDGSDECRCRRPRGRGL
jgi:peptide/nickel transport system substrate-binding protein